MVKEIILLGALMLSGVGNGELVQLTIEVNGILENEGKILVATIAAKDAAGFPDNENSFANYSILSPSKPKTVVRMDLPKGVYAISVLHDVNGNSKMDKNFFGVPQEPYGFSNNYKPIISSPDFDDCAIDLNGGSHIERIDLIH